MSSVSTAFINLCKELSFLQVGLLQRSGSPLALANQALHLLQRHSSSSSSSSSYFANGEPGEEAITILPVGGASAQLSSECLPYVPIFLRSCATLLDKVVLGQHHSPVLVLDQLEGIHSVATQYIGECHGDVNEACTVLRAVTQLDALQRRCYTNSPSPSPSLRNSASLSSPPAFSSPSSSSSCSFSSLVRPSYAHAYHQWHQQSVKVHTLSVLSLLQGCSAINAEGFHFPPSNPDQRGLLPVKNHVQMEAKIQRCSGARELLQSLKYMEMNRLDAGICLTTLADLGFYDADVCNMACEVFHSSHAMVTSQQFSQILFSLGILQHRHVYQRFFSSLLVPKQCNAEGIRQHVMGLAMLQQPPHSQAQLMDGVFLHALRGANEEKQRKQQRRRNRSSSSREEEMERRRRGDCGVKDPRYSKIYAATQAESSSDDGRMSNSISSPHFSSLTSFSLPYSWYVDVGYSLSCLDISHYKFKSMVARHCRGALPKMCTADRCKLLYTLGPVLADPNVPSELKEGWNTKVSKTFQVTLKMLENIELGDGPQVMHALRFCKVTEHPRLPPPHLLSKTMTDNELRENPVEVLLRTWAHTPKEYIIHLAEQIDTEQLHSCASCTGEEGQGGTGERGVGGGAAAPAAAAAKQLVRVVDALAKACPSPSPQDQYRFASLSATIEHHVKDFSAEDLLTILKGLNVLGLAPYYDETVKLLVQHLCDKKENLTKAQVEFGGSLLVDLGEEKSAESLKTKTF